MLFSPLELGRESDEGLRLAARLSMALPSAPGLVAAAEELPLGSQVLVQARLSERREAVSAQDEELLAEAQRVAVRVALEVQLSARRVVAVLSDEQVVPAVLSVQQQVAVERRAAVREGQPWGEPSVQPSDLRELVLRLAQRRKRTLLRHEPKDVESAPLQLQSSSAGSFESFSCCPVCEKKIGAE